MIFWLLSMENKFPINSLAYWNDRFENGSWSERLGEGQSKFFMQLLISSLPSEIFANIFTDCKTILDFGSALGQGCFELHKYSFNAEITGLDFAESAIEQASEMYGHLDIKFRSTPLQFGIDKFDCLVTSNVLEHLSDWWKYLDLFTQVAQKYIIILVPYQTRILDEHVVSFNDNSFPDETNGFNKVFEKIIQCDDPRYWTEGQLLLIYQMVR